MPTLGFANDGAMWTVNSESQARRQVGFGAWVVDVGAMLVKDIAAGSQAQIYAIGTDGNLYAFINSVVKPLDSTHPMKFISCSQTDDTLWGIDFQQNAWVYNFAEGRWDSPPSGTPKMTQVAVAGANNVVCITQRTTAGGIATASKWDGTSWATVVSGRLLGPTTLCIQALSDGTLFTIEQPDGASEPSVWQYTSVPNAGGKGVASLKPTQLSGVMTTLSAALDGPDTYRLLGFANNIGGYKGFYSYDFAAGSWTQISSDSGKAAAIPGGLFLMSGVGTGGEQVRRSEIANTWTTISMPFRSDTTMLCAKNANEFFALTSDGAVQRWGGLAWQKQQAPSANLVAVSVAQDGALFVVAENGNAYELQNGTNWIQHSEKVFADISACAFQNAYAIDPQQNLYALTLNPRGGPTPVWTPIALPSAVSASSFTGAFAGSLDGTLTISANSGGSSCDTWLFNPATQQWGMTNSIPGYQFTQLTAQDENHIFAETTDGDYWCTQEAAPAAGQEQVWWTGPEDLYWLLMGSP